MAVKDLQRLDDVDSVTISQLIFSCPPYHRIHVDRIHCIAIRVLVQYPKNCPEHMMHGFTKIFPSMCCDEDKLVIPDPICFQVKFRASLLSRGHWYRPFSTSSRLYRRTYPSPSQISTLMRSQRHTQNRKREWSFESSFSVPSTMALRPSMDLRISV